MAAVDTPPLPPAQAETGPSLIVQIAVLAIMTVAAVGIGWASGAYLNASRPQDAGTEVKRIVPKNEKADHGAKKTNADGEEETAIPVAPDIVPVEPITTNLAAPSDVWMRLELSLVFDGPPDLAMAQAIHQDILAYMRTVKLAQVEGASGFQHLKADLEERAAVRSGGKVRKILIRTLLFE